MHKYLVLFISLIIFNSFLCNKGNPDMNLPFLKSNSGFWLYSVSGNIVNVARTSRINENTFKMLRYDIDISKPEDAQQTFINAETIDSQQLDSTYNLMKKSYKWKPIQANTILFVQLTPKGFKDDIALLDKRQELEIQLTNILENNKSGSWSGSDQGPGGGNILFEISQIDKATKAILKHLQENNLEKQIIIGKRVMTGKQDWFYEVIYPEDYSGEFNTM